MSAAHEPGNPPYPDLGAGVAKFRRLAEKAGSIRDMARADVVAYADAIEKAIRAKHRTLHMRPAPPMTPGWYEPPSVARLLRYKNPIPMTGDPLWKPSDVNADHWSARAKAVYAAAMAAKRLAPPPY